MSHSPLGNRTESPTCETEMTCDKVDAADVNVKIIMNPSNQSRAKSAKSQKAATKYVIDTTCIRHEIWENVVLVSVFLQICLVVYFAAFDSTGMHLKSLSGSLDFIYLVYIFFKFFTPYTNKEGVLVRDLGKIRRHYLRREFAFDFLSILPFGLIGLALDKNNLEQQLHYRQIHGMNRLLRFPTINRYFGRREEDLGRSTSKNRSLKYVILCALTIHLTSCAWYGLACDARHKYTSPVCKVDSWAATSNLGFNLTAGHISNNYFASLYWAVATVTSTGYGDIYAKTIAEKWFSVFAMLAGISVFFGMLLGGMTSLLTNLDANRASFVHRFKSIKTYMKDLGVDSAMQGRVISYYEYLWQQKNGVVSEGIYSKLPITIQAEISQTTNSDTILKAPIFKNIDPGFLRMLSLSIKHVMYLPTQIVLKRGDISQTMFFIRHGEVEVMSETNDEVPVTTLESGSMFGEINLVITVPRTASVRAKTHCDMLLIDRQDLHDILCHFPEVADQLQAEVKKRFEGIQHLLKDRTKNGAATEPAKTLDPPKWLRTASFLVTKEDLSSFSQPGLKKGNKSTTQIDLEDLRKRHQTGRSWRSLCTLIWTGTIKDSAFFVRGWNLFILLVTIIQNIIVPYMAAFTAYDARKGYFDSMGGEVILGVTYLLDIFFLLDIWITFRTEIPGQYASIVDKKIISKMYVMSSNFWVDLCAVLPLEVFCLCVTGRNDRLRLYGFLRLNRLIKVTKVQRLFGHMESIMHVSISLMRSVKLALYICLLSHWAACTMFLMACSGASCKVPSWLSNRNETVVVDSAQSEYITSLYWAAATMTSTGYGDISAATTTGRVISLSIMIIGLLLYGYSIALMAATLANDDSARVRFQEKLFAVQKFMKENKLDLDLQHKVGTYMSLLWKKFCGQWMPGQKSLIHDAPMVLQMDIQYEDACNTIAKVPLFLDTDEHFLRELALKLQTYLYSPGDVVIYHQEVGREMYCIRRGWCQVETDEGTKLSEIGPGTYIGEVGLLFGDTRTATVTAITHCELVMLTMDDLHKVLKSFPVIKAQFEQAEDRKEELLGFKEHYANLIKELDMQRSQGKVLETTESDPTTKRKKRTSSTKDFKKTNASTNAEYLKPFQQLNPIARLFSSLLMRRTLMNSGPALTVWTVLMTVVAVISAFTGPLQGSFFHQHIAMWLINYLLDIFCWVNMYLSFHITFYNKESILVTHPLFTAKNYLRTNFLMDLVSCFPIEVFVYAVYPYLDYDGLCMLSLLRMNRLLQIYRLPMFFAYLESSVERETGTLREIKFGFYIIIFLNWLTCVVFMLACPCNLHGHYIGYVTLPGSGHQCLQKSWLLNSKVNMLHASLSKIIVKCLYWAAATTVSVGYGDISAYTNVEMIICLVAMVSGVIFFGYIIASVAASLANADAQRARFQEKLSSIQQYLEEEKLEAPLKKRILKYYDYLWLRTRGVDPESLFNVMPLSLWGDVTLDLYRGTLEGIELFKGTETSFLKMLSRCIKPVLFLKGEYVVRKFDMGDQMFFIQRGCVEVVSEDGMVVFATMREGNSFGEVALLFSVPRTASIRAGVNADMFSLSKSDLDNVLSLYPLIKEKVLMIAGERQEQARKRSMAKANEAKQKSKAGLIKASSKSIAGASTATSQAMAPEAEPEDDSESRTATPDFTKELDTDFVNVIPGSEDEDDNDDEEEVENENNNASNLNQNNNATPLDPHYGEFTSLEDWEMIELGNRILSKGNQNQNNSAGSLYQNNAGNRNQNNDNKDDAAKEKEAPKPKCGMFRRLAELNRFTIPPSSKKLKNFDSFMCIISFISVWMITYEATFQDHHIALDAVNYIIDVFFFFKIYICFHTSFYDEYGDLMDDFDVVYNNYLKQPCGFMLDLVAAFPLEIFALAAPDGKKMLAMSFLRLLHCLRYIRVSDYFQKWEKGLNINMLAARLSRFFVVLFLLIHLLSCIWYMLACPFAECKDSSWRDNQASSMDSHMNSYCVCVYWAVATMTSTGYGDVYATNVLEMLYASIVMVTGKLIFGFILGNIASTLSNEEIQKVEYQEKLEVMKNAMISEGVPPDLEHMVVNYMVHLWYRNKGIDPILLFKDAPDCLQSELFRKVAFDMFKVMPLFSSCEEPFLRALALRVQQHVYIPGNCIIRKGDIGKEVYFIHKGTVEVYDDEGFLQCLTKGQVFGEVSLLSTMTRQVDVKAKTHVDLLVLTMEDLDQVLESYPTVAAHIQNIGYQRFKDILGPDYLRHKSGSSTRGAR